MLQLNCIHCFHNKLEAISFKSQTNRHPNKEYRIEQDPDFFLFLFHIVRGFYIDLQNLFDVWQQKVTELSVEAQVYRIYPQKNLYFYE